MKALITGMTALQSSPRYVERNTCFASLIVNALESSRRTIEVAPPSVSWTRDDLESYDFVLVGLAPIGSMAANNAYGALSVIEQMWGSPKLRLFLDIPGPSLVTKSFHIARQSPISLTRKIYSARPGYRDVVSDQKTLARIEQAIEYLNVDSWPRTVYPSLPWGNYGKITSLLPRNAVIDMLPLHLDSVIFSKVSKASGDIMAGMVDVSMERKRGRHSPLWAADDVSSTWVQNAAATLRAPVVPAREHKGWTDMDVLQRLARSRGTLIAPFRDTGSWWTPRAAQSLALGTPVVTDWRESSILGDAWLDLPAAVDEMSDKQRTTLASAQEASYRSMIIPLKHLVGRLFDLLAISK